MVMSGAPARMADALRRVRRRKALHVRERRSVSEGSSLC
jgi:hypothetical protein